MARVSTRRRRAIILAAGAIGGSLAVQLAPPARADDPFTAGAGLASASAVNPVVAAGNLQIAVVAGQATASYRDRTAAGISTLFDVPALRSVSGTQVCGTTPAGLPIPTPLVADTGPNGDTEPVSASSPADGAGVEQVAAAVPGAHASASSGLASFDLPPLASVSGIAVTADTSADSATQTRTATASSEASTVALLGGLVTLHGLRWDVTQSRQGPDSRSHQTSVSRAFSLGSISIGLPGVPAVDLPVPSADQLGAVVAIANTLLAPLGVQLRLPTDQSAADAGIEGVSPLTIAIGGHDFLASPLLAALFTSDGYQQLTQLALHTAFDPQSCQQLFGLMQGLGPDVNATYNQFGATAPLLLAVIAGALGGTGEIQLNIGGVSTRLDDTYYAPPGFGPPRLGGGGPQLFPAPAAATPGASRPATPTPAGAAPVAGAPVGTAPAASTDGAQLASSTECRTTSPAGKPGCWLGRAPAGAVVAGAFTIGLLVADEVVRRRRSRTLEVAP